MDKAANVATDAAGNLMSQGGVLGTLLVIFVLISAGLLFLLIRSWKTCNEENSTSAKSRDALQAEWRLESKETTREISRALSETASSNVERSRTLGEFAEMLQKMVIGLDMLRQDILSNRERLMDRAKVLEDKLQEAITASRLADQAASRAIRRIGSQAADDPT